MHKLITYLKEGKGRGLKVMFIFSILATLLFWGINYSKLEQVPNMAPDLSSLNVLWFHIGFIFSGIILTWLIYLLVVGVSTLLALALRLKLSKGIVWRLSSCLIITFALITILTSLVTAGLLFVIALFLPHPESVADVMILTILNPIIFLTFFFSLFASLITWALTGRKEGKRKK